MLLPQYRCNLNLVEDLSESLLLLPTRPTSTLDFSKNRERKMDYSSVRRYNVAGSLVLIDLLSRGYRKADF